MNNSKILWVTVPLIIIFSTINFVLWTNPSSVNSILGTNVPEGVTLEEANKYKESSDECFAWGDYWVGDAKNGRCQIDDRIVKPINYWEKCGDTSYGYDCKSTSDGCIDGYVLVQDHRHRDLCVKEEHYKNSLTACDKYGEFWKLDDWTSSGYACTKMSESEILDVLIKEREALK